MHIITEKKKKKKEEKKKKKKKEKKYGSYSLDMDNEAIYSISLTIR